MNDINVSAKQKLLGSSLIKILNATPAPIILSKVDGSFEYVNQALLDMLGYTEDEIYSNNIVITHPDDVHLNKEIRQKLQEKPFKPLTLEKRYLHKSGKDVIGLLTMVAEPDDKGKVKRFIGQIIDITSYKKNQKDIQLFRTLINKSNDGMVVISPETGLFLDVNQQCCDRLGYSLDEMRKMTVQDIELSLADPLSWAEHVKEIKLTGSKILEGTHRCKDGSIFPVEISVSYVELANHDYMVAIIRDVSERKKKDEMIWKQANYDSLTNLPNRDMLRDRLAQEKKRITRSGKKIAVLCLDIDHFKDVNDSFGHDAGDQLLRVIANRVKQCTRDSDTVARLGGDEFALIISDLTDSYYVNSIAENILKKLEEPIDLGVNKAFVSASIGITLFPDDGYTTDELLKNADHAMYEVKNNGRKGYQYFTPVMHDKAVARIELINDLYRAIAQSEFEMLYQPIIDMKTRKVCKAEALICWKHPDKGIICPDSFIPAAEESGLIIDIGCWVFENVSKQKQIWKHQYNSDIKVSINMSPIQFHDKNDRILLNWFDCIKKYDLHGSDFTIEITEGVMMNTHDDIKEKLLLLRNKGVDIALDDFGTGYSSLAYLKKLDIDYLKIDRSFVTNLEEGSDNQALCEAIIMMANKLNLQVIAEGIETALHYKLLKKAGCDYGQGFLFSKGIAASEFTKLFIKSSSVQELIG